MYESFFDLSSRPFPAAPVVQYYFPTAVVEQARQTLIRIVDRAEGPGLIIGQPGLGKTLLLRMLDHHFQNVFHCIHLASAAIESRKDLLQNVLFELDLPYRNMEEGELRLSLLDFLRPSENCPHGVLLLVDEAHTLPLQLLDEIRMITNLVRDGQPRVRLVLAGDTQLDDVFADPRLDSFNQRIAARCYLEPLNQEQTVEYIRAQIATIGGDPHGIFTHDAMVAVYRASGGIPRVVNQVCDHALVMASLGGYHQIDASGIEEAWSDLQQLPGPWNDPAPRANAQAESIVEFGSLDEEDGRLATPVEHGSAGPAIETTADDVAESSTETFAEAVDSCEAELSVAVSETLEDTPTATPEVAAEPKEEFMQHNPDPANETPFDDADAFASQESQVDLLVDPFAPRGPFHSEFHSVDAGAGSYESNVLQVGWDSESLMVSANEDSGQDAAATAGVARPEEPFEAVAEAPLPTSERLLPESGPQVLDPFGHGFDEEEVVVDRYADRGGSVFAGRPRVASEEGNALAALMKQPSSPQLSVVAPEPVVKDSSDDAVASEERQAPSKSQPTESNDDTKPAAAQQGEAANASASNEEFSVQALATSVFDTSSLSDWLFESSGEPAVGEGAKAVAVTPAPEECSADEADQEAAVGEVDTLHDDGPSLQESQAPVAPLAAEEFQPAFLQMHEGPSFNDDRDMIVIDQDEHGGVFLTQSSDDFARRVEYQQLFSQLREG